MWPDKDIAEAQARENHVVVHNHRLTGRLAPTPQTRNAGIKQSVALGPHFRLLAALTQTLLPEGLVAVQLRQRLLTVGVLQVLDQIA